MCILTETHSTTSIMKRYLSLGLALIIILSCAQLGISAQAAAADYISASYASNLSVKTKTATALKAEPNNAGSAKYTLPANMMLTVKALHKNTAGTYYYEVLFYNMTLYVKASDCIMMDHLTGDIQITDALSPASLGIGDSFGIQGVITASSNIIGKVTAGMYRDQHLNQVPAISGSATVNAKRYSLAGSTVDSQLLFNSLSAGVYDYAVTVEAISHYIDDNGALATSSRNVIVERQQCVITDYKNPNATTAFGVDVSVLKYYMIFRKHSTVSNPIPSRSAMCRRMRASSSAPVEIMVAT